MRFIANGPSIPDELLLARDQGRVVFFCGAGVSRAKAKLPNFFELAAEVTKTLGVQEDDPAMKLIAASKEIGKATGIEGLISADRIFGLLERDFLQRDIYEAVAKALTPKKGADASAHQTLLRLATTREGLVRLVTTNFDRLFDQGKVGVRTFSPPNLPDPSRATELNGVVYLHGQMTPDGTGAEGEGFILSSSEFGRAYLSDGWATSFVREILRKYFVVFVGYSADDPPVQYLLEALSRSNGMMDGVYAFQAGDENYANSKWEYKGVAAIPYDETNDHSALWDTLESWATRADDPEQWMNGVVDRARQGPQALEPFERGQVAHLVSTLEGVRKFSEGDKLPPATWLCVFDAQRRFAKPGKLGRWDQEGKYVDPFDLYSLDSDPVPEKIDPEVYYASRSVPEEVWDAFALTKLDRAGLRAENTSGLKGIWSRESPRLPARLDQLGNWIAQVSSQPEAFWWAVRQFGVHPSIQRKIEWHLERKNTETNPAIRKAWMYLLEYWDQYRDEHSQSWFELARTISEDGWSEPIVRKFSLLSRPYLTVKENYWGDPIPDFDHESGLQDLVNLDVKYPDLPRNIKIPNEALERIILVLRRNLEVALELETEIGGFGLRHISPIVPDADTEKESFSRTHGLSSWVLYFISQFERLMAYDLDLAKSDFQKWPCDDQTIFARLRIWAIGQVDLVQPDQLGSMIAKFPDRVFWDSHHSRDLLLALSSRWNELLETDREEIEQRILKGPYRFNDEDDERYEERKAWSSLSRLNWLSEQGHSLQLDIEKINRELREKSPEWQPEYAKRAADSIGSRGGWVTTETDYSALLNEPLSTTLAKAEELSGRQGRVLVEHKPFAGLSQERPVRAFAALRLEAKKGEFPEWAWRAFLNPDTRENDQLRFTGLIAEQISRYPNDAIIGILWPVTEWLAKSAKTLASKYPVVFSRLISQQIGVLALDTEESKAAIERQSKDVDWTMEAINSPTGRVAEALMDDPRKEGIPNGDGLPVEWLKQVEALLELPGDLRRHAIVFFSYNLSWFFAVDPIWTSANLLSILTGSSQYDKEALWAGFLWGGKATGFEFFQTLKPHMLELAKSSNLERLGHTEAVAGLLLSAWALTQEETGEKWVSDSELHDVLVNSSDDMRSQVLWLGERWSQEKREIWLPLLLELLRTVWPRQIAAKSGLVSARLCDIAFSDEERFPELVVAILPLVARIDRDHLVLPNLRRSRDSIVDRYPHDTLSLLHIVLPVNVAAWPYGIESVLARIGEADATLNSDERLIELKRRWDSR